MHSFNSVSHTISISAINVHVNVDVNSEESIHKHHNPHHHQHKENNHHLSVSNRGVDPRGVKVFKDEVAVFLQPCVNECGTGYCFHLATLNDEDKLSDRGTVALREVGTLRNRTFVTLEDLTDFPFTLCDSEHGCDSKSSVVAGPLLHAGDHFTFNFPDEKIYSYGTTKANCMGNTIETMHNPPKENEAELDIWNYLKRGAGWAFSNPDRAADITNLCITACHALGNALR